MKLGNQKLLDVQAFHISSLFELLDMEDLNKPRKVLYNC